MVEHIGVTELESLFMSHQNRTNLHYLIRKETHRITGKLIGQQSDLQLRMIQRVVFDNYAQHRPNHLLEQINALNQQTLRFCMKSISDNLSNQEFYVNNLDENQNMRPRDVIRNPQATEVHSNRSMRIMDRGLNVFNPYADQK